MRNRCYYILLLAFLSLLAKAQEPNHLKIDSLNSSYDEHSPVLSPDGQTLYFTRVGHAANIGGVLDRGDIWLSRKTKSGWSRPEHAGKTINHPGLNGVVGFSADGQRMYLLNYFDPNGNGGGNMRNGIAVSRLENGEWSTPERLRISYFSNDSPHISATINPEETVLIMAIRSYESEGNEDLYVSFKQADGEWSQPENLGNTINTYGEEWSPFLAADNETLYFSSNAHGGFGGRDIFMSKRLNGSWKDWSKPTNLGGAINTKGTERDYFIPASGTMAFFSSTQNSEGYGDIFNFPLSQEEKAFQQIEAEVDEPQVETEIVPEKEKSIVVMTFQVLDKRTEQPVDAQVKFTYGDKEITLKTADIDSENKHFVLSLEEGANVYVAIEAEGFLKYQETFVANASVQGVGNEFGGSTVETFYLTPEEVGTKVKIENVLFNRASSSFANPEVAMKQLDQIVQMMKSNPGMAIRLEGHTDNRGDAKLLKELSVERVKRVRDYLIDKGIEAGRVEYVGYGGEQPLTDNDSATGREINRRVEFVIIR
ncbi:OmpA family protein [Roseivirga thermotolerans]|uniref:Membrane protein n=1 Tax=Roseivirga thermotolerans TaxID=1758176 RepID=A0ABQ3I4H5_9BACT|nr:OmpA family protein [Roseivirga thermotolerans]GHE63275.1 membrane protein [Roseivirga thermotolerans]